MLTNALLLTLLALSGADAAVRANDVPSDASVVHGMPSRDAAAMLARADRAMLERLSDSAWASLDSVGVDGIVTARVKSPASLLAKMQRKQLPLEAIHDRLAVRIRVDEEADCYRVLDALHERFTPIEAELDDYIAAPKPSGYRSLHTAVRVGTQQTAEFQVRTHAMHAEAETGRAAHWRYKAGLLAS